MEISVIIPVFNRAHLVSDTLQSVFEQSHRPIHLILVDNNSTDGTLSVLNNFKAEHDSPDFKVSVTSEHQKGAAAARNTGAALATSDWIMFFDSDDTMAPDLLQTYAEKIKAEGNEYDVFACRIKIIGLNNQIKYSNLPIGDPLTNQLLYAILATQRYIIRRISFYNAGGWNPTVMGWDDLELGMRIILSQARIGYIGGKPKIFAYSQTDSITGTDFSSKSDYWEYSLNLVETSIQFFNPKNTKKLLRLINYRRTVLASFYKKEGAIEKGQNLLAVVKKKSNNIFLYLIYYLIYIYVAHNGRGTLLFARYFL